MQKSNLFINLEEFKLRVLYLIFSFLVTFGSCFFFKLELFFFISQFFLKFENGFIYTNLLDPIIFYIKLSLLIMC